MSRYRKDKIYATIFEAETPQGRFFDLLLLVAILISVLIVLLESVSSIRVNYGSLLLGLEWGFTILFTIEYILRLYCVRSAKNYATSFFGVVDLAAILPTYLSLVIPGSHSLIVIRALRLLRVFRILKLARYLKESEHLLRALNASKDKITVFLIMVVTLTLIMGTAMYLIEGEEHGFTSIPKSMYWAIVTMTTVGYGDIAPETVAGQFLATIIMIMGYAVIVVPTGIFSVELSRTIQRPVSSRSCPACSKEGLELDSTYCRFCGEKL